MISESAIGMSNGGRVSSARDATKKIRNPAICGNTNHTLCCCSAMNSSDRLEWPATLACRMTAAAARISGSSYAMSWAAARRAPISENLFALAHPAIMIPMIETDVIAST